METFSQGSSLLHRSDPRIKICLIVPYALTVVLLTGFPAALTALGMSTVLLLLARLPRGPVLARLALVNIFILFLWVFLPFSAAGQAVFTLGPLTCTTAGLALAGLITLKSNAVVLAVMALLSTSSTPALGYALSRLGLPDKLTFLLLISYRYLYVILEEYHRLDSAARARAFKPGTNLHTYKTYGYLLAMVLVNSYDRAGRVYQAMLLRGFQGKFYSLQELALTRRDVFFSAGMAATVGALIIVDFSL
jgi:cobalt/nickel transport system permease protein